MEKQNHLYLLIKLMEDLYFEEIYLEVNIKIYFEIYFQIYLKTCFDALCWLIII